jgi:hypothetical protein
MDILLQSNWRELHSFLMQGSPPLGLQLLGLNVVFFLLWLVRRWRGAPRLRQEMALIVPALVIGANVLILLRGGRG